MNKLEVLIIMGLCIIISVYLSVTISDYDGVIITLQNEIFSLKERANALERPECYDREFLDTCIQMNKYGYAHVPSDWNAAVITCPDDRHYVCKKGKHYFDEKTYVVIGK